MIKVSPRKFTSNQTKLTKSARMRKQFTKNLSPSDVDRIDTATTKLSRRLKRILGNIDDEELAYLCMCFLAVSDQPERYCRFADRINTASSASHCKRSGHIAMQLQVIFGRNRRRQEFKGNSYTAPLTTPTRLTRLHRKLDSEIAPLVDLTIIDTDKLTTIIMARDTYP